jgi:hypothetical protein|tara:strand:- start:702 stop:974 length:273 start_codon:yes stop_codon:yes gene_type:complete
LRGALLKKAASRGKKKEQQQRVDDVDRGRTLFAEHTTALAEAEMENMFWWGFVKSREKIMTKNPQKTKRKICCIWFRVSSLIGVCFVTFS